MRFALGCVRVSLVLLLCLSAVVWGQTTGSITGTVHDKSGAVIANAQVTVSNEAKGINRTTPSNASGEYLVAGLGQGTYNITVSAEGFKKFEAKDVVLDVAQKARVDIALEVGAISAEITVEGTAVAQVETQSSDLTGTVSGKEISQLQLNGRNFTQLVTLVPGVSSQTGQDEGTVGVYGNVAYSVNGGRTEYNNWELDGGDNMDNGSNTTLNVYPSLDAIGEFKVLTSNYGAQYGRSGSGTVEVETKSGTNAFHGDVYEFNRNTAYNARNYFTDTRSSYKKNDYGYTIGGPIFIPGVYNKDKQKTFFFWSEEWRKEKVPGKNFNVTVPTAAERGGDFSVTCVNSPSDCPHIPNSANPFPGDIVPTSASDASAVTGLLALIPAPNSGTNTFLASPVLPTNWREELVRVDHNLTSNERLTFRYIHDSWDTISPTPLWTNAGSFPTIETNFKGPSVSSIARLSSTLSPTLLNEFQMSYTTDHIVLINQGAWQRGNAKFGDLFGGNGGGVIPGFNFGGSGAFGGLGEDPGYIPQGPYNSNPTYTYRDNMIKIVGKHNLQFGAYVVTAQKNELGAELGAGSTPGYLSFSPSNPNSTGNVFADLLNGQIFSFGQQSQRLKYYNRYKIVEPYFQDDFHVSSHLTVNLGLRLSLFGTYRDKQHFAFNFNPNKYVKGQTTVNADGTVNFLTVNGLAPSVTNLPNGIVQCGVTSGTPVGCMQGHLFNPAPRIGFAWDPKGDGKWAVRGGYGIFFEHTNGNEGNTESLENSPPLATTVQQIGIQGYQNIGTGLAPGAQLPLAVVAVPTRVKWPYVQQWHFDLQHEVVHNTVATISYVGSKGTHLTRVRNLNQVAPPPFTAQNPNPYKSGEAFSSNDCSTGTTSSGAVIPGYTPPLPNQSADPTKQTPGTPGVNLYIACGNSPDFFRPIPGYGNITSLESAASSTYHGMEFGVRRSVGGLELNLAYTYSHSIDNSSSRGDNDLVNAYAPNANRASSTFDQRHNLNFAYVWDLPFFKERGLTHTLLGGWQYSGIMDFSTGSPFTVTFGSDNAGVGNGVSNSAAAYADIIGDPNAGGQHTVAGSRDIQIYNQAAYAAPRGLTFGDSGRNSLRNPHRTNFDMSLFKHFAITEHMRFEFRAEAFNVFNHTQLGFINGDGGSGANNSANLNSSTAGFGGSQFLQITQAHNPRILQLGAKFIF
jgi:hypothetical protein